MEKIEENTRKNAEKLDERTLKTIKVDHCCRYGKVFIVSLYFIGVDLCVGKV